MAIGTLNTHIDEVLDGNPPPSGARVTPYVTNLPPRAELVRRLTGHLTLNSFGLPEGIYRPDLLPDLSYETLIPNGWMPSQYPLADVTSQVSAAPKFDIEGEIVGIALDQDSNDNQDDHDQAANLPTSGESPTSNGSPGSKGELVSASEQNEHEKLLRTAFLPLSYVEGFPAQPDGRPFWHKFDFELQDAHEAFQAYLAQGNAGARQLFLLPETLEASGMNGTTPNTAELQEFFHLYYWDFRARAFDLFRVAEARKIRENRAFSTENGQYLLASRLQDMIETYMLPDPNDPNSESDFLELMTPKAAIDLLKLVTQLQRINVGLPANAPAEALINGNSEHTAPGASLEVILRSVSRQSNPSLAVVDESPKEANERMVMLEKALEDPHTAELAQELIIRIDRP